MNHKVLIRNVTLLRGDRFEVCRGDIHISNGKIVKVAVGMDKGAEESGDNLIERASDGQVTVIDGSNRLVIPGFVNAHCHVLDGMHKESWVGRTIEELFAPAAMKCRAISSTPDQQLKETAAASLTSMIKNGVTAACVFVEDGLRGVKLLKEVVASKARAAPHTVLLARPSCSIPEASELAELAAIADGFAPGSISPLGDDVLVSMRARSEGKVRATHVAEYKDSASVKRAVDLLGVDFLVHGNYLTQDQFALLRDRQVGLVCCIRSGSSFGHETPDVGSLAEQNITFALGTDNIMSNSPDIFRELEFVMRQHLYRHRGKTCITPERLLRAATYDACKLVGLPQRGLVQEGFYADLVVMDLDENLSPFRGAESVIFRGNPSQISHVLLDGEIAWSRGSCS